MAGNAQLDTGQGGRGADGSREGDMRRATTDSRMGDTAEERSGHI